MPELSFFKMLLFCNIAFLFNYISGHLFVSVLRIKSKNFILNDFIKCVSGALLIIFFYSIYKTNIFTINILLLQLAALLYFPRERANNFRSIKMPITHFLCEISLRNLIYYIFLLCFFFTILFFKIKNPFTDTFYSLHGDYYAYSLAIEFLNKTGVEGNIYEWYFSNNYQHSIYHFGELWYSAFFAVLLNIKSLFALILVFWPIFYLFTVLGVMSILLKLKDRFSNSIVFFSIFFLFIAGISFYIPKNTIFTQYDWWDLGVFYFAKISFPLVVLLLCINLLIEKKYHYFFILLLILPILSTPTAPAVYIAATLFSFYLWYKNEIARSQFFQTVLIILSSFCYLLVYIYIISSSNQNSNNTSNISSINLTIQLFNIDYIRTFINCIAGQVIKIILSNSIYILVYIVLLRKTQIFTKNYIIFFFLLLLNFAGLFSYSIFHTMVDSIQFWILFYIPINAFFCTLILFSLYQKDSLLYKSISIILVCTCFCQTGIYKRGEQIDIVFCKKIYTAYKQKTKNKNIVSLKSGNKDFTDIFSKNIITFIPLGHLIYFIDDYHPVSISSFDIPRNKENKTLFNTESLFIENSTFYKFVTDQKKNNMFNSIAKSQIDFIKSYKAGFIILSPNANISPELNELIIDRIISEDKNYIFCTLNY